jgi:hypothetical protein
LPRACGAAVPELFFQFDESVERQDRIEQILLDLKRSGRTRHRRRARRFDRARHARAPRAF